MAAEKYCSFVLKSRLGHARSHEYDSSLEIKYTIPIVICVTEVELWERGEPIYSNKC